jgi:outer membrane protein assembly factor BamB
MRSIRFLNGLAILTIALLACAALVCALRRVNHSDRNSDLTVAVHTRGRTDVADGAKTELGWPNLFGPTHNSVSTEGALVTACPTEGPAVLWRAAIGEGYSSPIAAGDDVIVFHRPWLDGGAADQSHGPSETITCLDLATGQRRWEYSHPTSFLCRTHYSSGPYSTPVMDAERIYALGTEGNLYCLERRDGTLLWKRELWRDYGVRENGYFPPAGSPLLYQDRLILNLGAEESDAGVIAIDVEDGRTIWKATNHGAGYATPCSATIHNRPFVFVFTARGLVALDPTTGKEYWQIEFRAKNPELVNATSPIVYGDMVVTSGYSLGNLCLQIQSDGSFKELWRDKRRSLDSQYNPLLCIDGWLYGFAAGDDTFRCLNLRTGELQWKGLRQLERGAAIAVGDSFIILGTRGQLATVSIDHRGLAITGETQKPVVNAPAYSFPAFHRGRLFVRNEVEVVCLDMQEAKPGRRSLVTKIP